MDLSTTYLGLRLKHPLIASSSPLTGEFDNLRRLEDAGAAAVVLPSIFEEQIEHEGAEYERWTGVGAESFPEASSYFPSQRQCRSRTPPLPGVDPARSLRAGNPGHRQPERHHRVRLDGIRQADRAGWRQRAGTQHLLCPGGCRAGRPDGRAASRRCRAFGQSCREAADHGQIEPLFQRARRFGASTRSAPARAVFVLFNRFYQPDIDLAAMRLRRDLDLSTPAEMRLPLLWIGVLTGQISGSIAATTGVYSAEHAVKYLLAGADVVMTASALLRYGIDHMRTLLTT